LRLKKAVRWGRSRSCNFCWVTSANTGWEKWQKKWHLLKKQKSGIKILKVAKKVASLEKTKKWHKNIKSGKKKWR
jgi:hypothetical protein